jgi:hypothetical protein
MGCVSVPVPVPASLRVQPRYRQAQQERMLGKFIHGSREVRRDKVVESAIPRLLLYECTSQIPRCATQKHDLLFAVG